MKTLLKVVIFINILNIIINIYTGNMPAALGWFVGTIWSSMYLWTTEYKN